MIPIKSDLFFQRRKGMNAKKPYALLLLTSLIISLVACVSRPVDSPQGNNAAPAQTTLVPSTLAVPGAATLPPVSASSTTAATSVPPSATVIPVDEEDCMAGCHPPDPNENIAAGANPQPASHAGRTACLVCHATQAQPTLPATHTGRLDPSCTVCHK